MERETWTTWQKKIVVSLTSCWLCNKKWSDCLAEKKAVLLLTHYLSWIGHQTIWQKCNNKCHSLSVDHIMICDEIVWQKRSSVTYNLWVMEGDMIRLPDWKYIKCHSQSVGYSVRWDALIERKDGISHKLLVMVWDMIRLPGRQKRQCHSLTVGHEMRCNVTACKTNVESVTHLLLIIWPVVMRLPGRKKGNVTDMLLIME